MAGITLQLEAQLKSEIEHFAWVNWSEIAREEVMKKEIFERFVKTGTLGRADQEFCDKRDWYPVDQLPLKEEFIKKLRKAKKEPSTEAMTPEDFGKWCEDL